MRNIFIIHSLNGDTLEFWGQDVKQKFEGKLNVIMPNFPIRAESRYEKFDEILSKYLETKELNESSIVVPPFTVDHVGFDCFMSWLGFS